MGIFLRLVAGVCRKGMPRVLVSQWISHTDVAWQVVNGDVDCTAIKFVQIRMHRAANVDCIVHCWSLCEEPDGVATEQLRYTAYTDLWNGPTLGGCFGFDVKAGKGVKGASPHTRGGVVAS